MLLEDLGYQKIEWALQENKQDLGKIIFLPFSLLEQDAREPDPFVSAVFLYLEENDFWMLQYYLLSSWNHYTN